MFLLGRDKNTQQKKKEITLNATPYATPVKKTEYASAQEKGIEIHNSVT